MGGQKADEMYTSKKMNNLRLLDIIYRQIWIY